jgi:hypothetical protein
MPLVKDYVKTANQAVCWMNWSITSSPTPTTAWLSRIAESLPKLGVLAWPRKVGSR